MKELLIIGAIFCYPGNEDCIIKEQNDKNIERVFVRTVTDWKKIEEKPIYREDEKDIRTRYQRLPN